MVAANRTQRQSLFESERNTLEDSIELSLASLRAYGERYSHWAIAYSGGKDSSATVTFVAWAIKSGRVPAPKSLTQVAQTGQKCYNYTSTNHINSRSDARNALRPDTRKDKFLMHDDNTLPAHSAQITPLKQCKKCQRMLPASLDYYGAEKRTKIGLQSWCRECLNANRRQHRKANPDSEREYQKRRRQEKPEQERERLKKWRAANPEKRKEQYRRNHERHRAERNADAKRRVKVLYQKHPERWLIASHARRARIAGSSGTFTTAEWEDLKAAHGHKCLSCGIAEPEIQLTVDHVVPLSKGGPNTIENIQPLCLSCNSTKKNEATDYRVGEK